MGDLKRKMRELTKTEGAEQGARGQRLRMSDREKRDTSVRDREGRKADPGEIRARSMMQTANNLMGSGRTLEGQRMASERVGTMVKSKPMSARGMSNSMSARASSRKGIKSKKVKGETFIGNIVVKKEKFTDSENEKKEDKPKKVEKKKNLVRRI